MTTTPKYRAPALDRGLDILELLARTSSPLSMTEIAAGLGYSRNEIFRMLQVLEERNYIKRDEYDTGYTLTNLANLRRELGDPAAALALAREAIALGDLQPSRGLVNAYTAAGLASLALNRRDEAKQALESAIAITEDLRTQVSGGELERERFLEASLMPYQTLMSLLLDDGANDAALQLAERTRARSRLRT